MMSWLLLAGVVLSVLFFVLWAKGRREPPTSLAEPDLPPLALPPLPPRPPQPQIIHVKIRFLLPGDDDEPLESEECPVAGINHNNIAGFNRQTVIARCQVGEQIYLVREPDNPHDENAIRCFRTNGEDIGYLPAWKAEEIAPILDKGRAVTARILRLEPFTSDAGNRLTGVALELTPYRKKRKKHSKSLSGKFTSPPRLLPVGGA
jgi:hypothetical protein